MRRDSNLLRRHALVSAVIIIFGSCVAADALAEVPAYPPALTTVLAGHAAAKWLDGTWAKSGVPQASVEVLVMGSGPTVKVLVLGRTMADAHQRLENLRVHGDIEECFEGETCCHPGTKNLLINAQHESWIGWIRVSRDCQPSPVHEERWTDDESSTNEPGINFVEIEPALWELLVQEQGVTHRFLTGYPGGQMLVKPSSDSGELWLQRSAIMLAGHIPDNPPAGLCGTVSYCKNGNGRRCNADVHPTSQAHGNTKRHHWYVKDPTTGDWCEQSERCSCQP